MFEQLKSRMNEIIAVVNDVPEEFKDKCFEVLLNAAIQEKGLQPAPVLEAAAATPAGSARSGDLFLNAKIRSFMRRNGITDDELNDFVMVEDGEVHFIHKPAGPNAKMQMDWALMSALQNALLDGEFEVEIETVRKRCSSEGCYDAPNFAKHFKRSPGDAYFKTVLTASSGASQLTSEGEARLAQIIKQGGRE